MHGDRVLHGDVLAKIMTYLSWMDVVRFRSVASQWRGAATITPIEELRVNPHSLPVDLRGIAQCIPKVQSLRMDQTSEIDDEILADGISDFLHLKHLTCLYTNLRFCFQEILKL